MTDSPKKMVLINPDSDSAFIISDDGLLELTEENEWRLSVEEGDISVNDYADYEGQTSECD
jgi:hypothetical protein